MKLADMTTGHMEHGLRTNPNASSFPWNTEEWGAELPRHVIVAELERRAILASRPPEPAGRVSAGPLLMPPPVLEMLAERNTEPFVCAGDEQKDITVLLFTSPIPSHPNIWILEQVYNSIRFHLPDVRIIILADGVKGGLEPSSYREFKDRVRERGWEMIEFPEWSYQTLMLRHALLTPGIVKTPLVMVGEHDWGFRKKYINWRGIVNYLQNPFRNFNSIQIRQDVLGQWELSQKVFGEFEAAPEIGLLPTTCFQCPVHISRSDWYRKLAPFLDRPEQLENRCLGNVLESTGAINEMAAYIPMGPIGRLYHLDGRGVTRLNQLGGIE